MNSEKATQSGDEEYWIKQPTEKFHGLRVVDHDGTAFVETVDDADEEHLSIMVDEEEVGALGEALTEITAANNHESDGVDQ